MDSARRSGKSWVTSLVVVLTITMLASACGGTAPPEVAPLRGYDGELIAPGDTLGPPPTDPPAPGNAVAFVDEEEATAPKNVVSPGNAVPDSLAVSSNDVRITADGIKVRVYEEAIDFGDGPEDAWWIEGKKPSGGAAGVTFTPRQAETSTLDSVGWAASGGVYVMRAEVGPQVTELRLTSSEGNVDRVAPDAQRFAVLAVYTDDHETITLDALDATGAVVATCSFEVNESFGGFALIDCG